MLYFLPSIFFFLFHEQHSNTISQDTQYFQPRISPGIAQSSKSLNTSQNRVIVLRAWNYPCRNGVPLNTTPQILNIHNERKMVGVEHWGNPVNWSSTLKKTEFIVFGSKAQCQKISSHFPVSILGSLLHPVDSVRNLGVWFDADFSFSEHIKRTCKACFLQMRDLRRIRKYLTSEVAVLAANALVSSRLDYCKS